MTHDFTPQQPASTPAAYLGRNAAEPGLADPPSGPGTLSTAEAP